MAELRSQLEAARREIAELRRRVEGAPRRPLAERLFLSLAGAATALGLGKARLQELIRAGALRTVSFPDGSVRVPRSELDRIDALGLEVAIATLPIRERSPLAGPKAVDDAPATQPLASVGG